MNRDLTQIPIENDLNLADYQILFKGIWTGVLISLIFHQIIIHWDSFILSVITFNKLDFFECKKWAYITPKRLLKQESIFMNDQVKD